MKKEDNLSHLVLFEGKELNRTELAQKLSVACETQASKLFLQKDKKYAPLVIYLLTRYLSGKENLVKASTEIDSRFFLRAMMTGKASTIPLKKLCKQTMRFIEGKDSLSNSFQVVDIENLNGFLVNNSVPGEGPKGRILDDLLTVLKDDDNNLLGRVFLGFCDWYEVRPFTNGNGRTWRCIAWHLLSERYGDLQSLLIIFYVKIVNPIGFNSAHHSFKNRDFSQFFRYWQDVLSWSADSFLFMLHVFEGGHSEVGSLNDQIKNILEFEQYLNTERRSYQQF